MSSKRAIRRKACTGKVRYTTFGAARRAMRSLARFKPTQWPMQAYSCSSCGGFHFGHIPMAELRRRGGV